MTTDHEPRLTPWLAPSLYQAPSAIHGRGIFTRTAVQPGEVLMRWGGLLIPEASYDPARHRGTSATRYDESRLLVTPLAEEGDLSERLNHSCDANTWLADAITVVARRAIAAGDEVTLDCATWLDDDWIYADRCGCGSPLCRGVLHGKDWQRPELQRRYAGHFASFLNLRIARLATA